MALMQSIIPGSFSLTFSTSLLMSEGSVMRRVILKEGKNGERQNKSRGGFMREKRVKLGTNWEIYIWFSLEQEAIFIG